MSLYTVGVQEAFDIEAGNTFALDRAIARECPRHGSKAARRRTGACSTDCPPEIRRIAHDIAMTYRRRVEDVTRVFRTLLQQLKAIDAPKTVVWVSEGLPMPFDSRIRPRAIVRRGRSGARHPLRDSPGPQFHVRRLDRQTVADARWKTVALRVSDSICLPACRAERSSRRLAPATTPSTESRAK